MYLTKSMPRSIQRVGQLKTISNRGDKEVKVEIRPSNHFSQGGVSIPLSKIFAYSHFLGQNFMKIDLKSRWCFHIFLAFHPDLLGK